MTTKEGGAPTRGCVWVNTLDLIPDDPVKFKLISCLEWMPKAIITIMRHTNNHESSSHSYNELNGHLFKRLDE